MVAQAFTVDLDKPLVFQVGHLEEQYQDWVHQPIVSKEGPRFFANDVLGFLTHTKWWAIPLIWLPVVCWCLNQSIQMGHTVPEVALLVVTGIFIWTLIEYTLHRYLFHINTKSYWTNTAHYLLHGCHHKHPMDGLRLVFPPTAAAILCYPGLDFRDKEGHAAPGKKIRDMFIPDTVLSMPKLSILLFHGLFNDMIKDNLVLVYLSRNKWIQIAVAEKLNTAAQILGFPCIVVADSMQCFSFASMRNQNMLVEYKDFALFKILRFALMGG